MDNKLKHLKKALAQVANEAEPHYAPDTELFKLNTAAIRVFDSKHPVRAFDADGGFVNVTYLAVVRVSRFMHRKGIDWPELSWEELIDWLKENWDEVLRVLITILGLLII